MIMVVVSTRDFRANQTKFMRMAREGKQVMLRSKREGSFMLTPAENLEDVITPELQVAIDKARKEFREGKTLHFDNAAEALEWMDSL
mgnify:CR=1 FL=1